MLAFCPLCASEDYTATDQTNDGRVFAVCRSPDHGEEGYVWEPTPPQSRSRRGDGLGSDLDIWDKLLACVPTERTHASGVVEDQFIERYHAEASVVWDRYGHRWREGKKSVNQYTMSAYLFARLSDLADEGFLVKTFGPAEVPWAYNGVISHWARA